MSRDRKFTGAESPVLDVGDAAHALDIVCSVGIVRPGAGIIPLAQGGVQDSLRCIKRTHFMESDEIVRELGKVAGMHAARSMATRPHSADAGDWRNEAAHILMKASLRAGGEGGSEFRSC